MKGTKGFTLLEILVVIGLLLLLMAILLPVFATVRESARGASCLSRERQIGLALACYVQDYDGALVLYASCPAHDRWWFDTLQPYTAGPAVFGCPSVASQPLPAGLGFGVNYLGVIRYPASCPWNAPGTAGPVYEVEFSRPAETLVLADAVSSALYDPYYVGAGADPGFAARHNDHANLLFLDGHTRAFAREAFVGKVQIWGHD